MTLGIAKRHFFIVSNLNFQPIVCKMHILWQAFLNLCMETDVVHHMREIGFAWGETINYAQCLEHCLVAAVWF